MYDDSLPHRMREAADHFVRTVRQLPAVRPGVPPALPPHDPGLVWQNTLFHSASFRRLHIELFEVRSHFAVLHVCVLPHVSCRAPIFGFDMVAGLEQATGMFLDYSPVTACAPAPCLGDVVTGAIRASFKTPRAAPSWGSIFSKDFFAIRPADRNEVETALTLAERALEIFLASLPEESQGLSRQADEAAVKGQTAYAMAQRQNPHTFRMLSRHVGQHAARTFIDEILFPVPA